MITYSTMSCNGKWGIDIKVRLFIHYLQASSVSKRDHSHKLSPVSDVMTHDVKGYLCSDASSSIVCRKSRLLRRQQHLYNREKYHNINREQRVHKASRGASFMSAAARQRKRRKKFATACKILQGRMSQHQFTTFWSQSCESGREQHAR